MWLVPIIQFVALAAAPPASPPAAQPNLPAPVCTRQTLFAIPFRIDRPESINQEPVEVQLYVSGDYGAHWDLYGKAEPARQQFLFRAGADGEFWFAVRTRDRAGQIRPDGPYKPALRVVVDTTPPKLKLDARRGDAGQIVLRWQLDEAYPKTDSLTIQYRTSAFTPWQSVAIRPQDARTNGTVQTGEVTWLAPAGTRTVEIRAEAADMAGNPAVSQAQVNLADARPNPNSPAPGGPDIAKRADTWRPADPDPPPTTWPAEAARPGGPVAGDRPVTQNPPTGPLPTVVNGRTQVALSVDGQRVDPQTGVALRVNPPIRNQYVVPDENAPSDTPPQNNSLRPPSGNPPPTTNTTAAVTPPAVAPPAVTPPAGAATGSVPPGERVRMVNARAFPLEYDVESVGPSGIGRVELWCTRDGGRTWRSFGLDDDRKSPFLVTVNEDGIYGFRITVQSGAGLGGKPPQDGDLPEVWIGVDLTKPSGRITGAEQGTGTAADKLNITWEAADNMKLASRPIAISFSETLGGPWTPIASGLENTGRYTWTMDSRAPQRVFLRLEVRDEAGNVATYETPEPLALDHAVPAARIRDVRPLGESGQRMPQFLR